MSAAARRVIVVGAGIAGIACALRLARAGVAVTLLETRKKLGGRATSFIDPRTGEVLDNCQHIAMGCCTNYLRFCRMLGVRDRLQWLREICWVETGGRVSVFRPGLLPAPAHFAGAFIGAAFLTSAQKARVALAMGAIARCDRANHTRQTFAQWLTAHAQRDDDIRRFWEPVVVSACNLTPARVCAATALHVFQEGFLAHRDAAAIGVSAVPLLQLYDPAEAALRAAGGVLRLGTSVTRITPREVECADAPLLHADAVVCALPFERAARIVDGAVRAADPRFDRLAALTHSPILGVHLSFDRPVMPMPAAALVERPTQWIFRKDEEGRRVHAVISAADDWMPLTEDDITRRVTDDIRACFPAAASAQVTASRSVKEKLATFAPTPEAEAARPDTLGPNALEGVVLAGDFVRTGWPATMEGAARSGFAAAAAVLGEPLAGAIEPPLKPGVTVRALCPALAAMR